MVTSHITDRISGTWATSLMLHNRRRRNFRFWNGCDAIQDGGRKRKLRLRLVWSIKLVAYTTSVNGITIWQNHPNKMTTPKSHCCYIYLNTNSRLGQRAVNMCHILWINICRLYLMMCFSVKSCCVMLLEINVLSCVILSQARSMPRDYFNIKSLISEAWLLQSMILNAVLCRRAARFSLLQSLWKCRGNHPGSKVHGANMGPTWGLSAPDGPHVGPWTLQSGRP